MRRLLAALLICLAPVTTAMAGKIAFSLPDTNGKIHTMSQYAGKWVVINYWATFCAPCIGEIPQLRKFLELHKGGDAVVLGVDFEDIPTDWLKDFMDSVSMSYPVLRSDPSRQATPFGVIGALPTTFIISPTGELVARHSGVVTAAELDAFIKRQRVAAETDRR